MVEAKHAEAVAQRVAALKMSSAEQLAGAGGLHTVSQGDRRIGVRQKCEALMTSASERASILW